MNSHVDVLASIIIQQYFWHSRCVIIFSDNSSALEYTGNLPFINLRSESGGINSKVLFCNYGCQGIVIKSKEHENIFKSVEFEIKKSAERFNQRKYLFIPSEDDENLSKIFELDVSKYVSDLIIVQKDYETRRSGIISKTDITFSLWSQEYIGSRKNNRKVHLDKWFSRNQSFKFGTPLYKNNLLNQMGRDLEMATFQYEPYSIIGSSEKEYKGSELTTALIFAKKYNMTPILVVNPEDYWGEIFENWTGTGLLGNLVMDRADIGFAALYTWEIAYSYLDLSKPLVRTGITCLVPAPKLAAGWLTPLYSYSKTMWFAVGSMFVLSIVSYFFIQFVQSTEVMRRYDSTKRNVMQLLNLSIFTVFKLFALQVVTQAEQPRSFVGKFYVALLFGLSIFLSSSYSSGLSSIMTIPRYENPINTVEEFSASGIHWGALQDAWTISIRKIEDPIYRRILSRFISTSEKNLREYSMSSSFAFSLERLPNNNYAIGNYIRDDIIDKFRLMREDLYWEQCVMMTRKSSILLPMLDMFILRVFETGLISYWQNEATLLYMNADVQRAMKFYSYNSDKTVVKLKWIHVEGAFGILSLGLFFSIFVFTLEIMIYRTINEPSYCTKIRSNLMFPNFEWHN